MKKQTTEQVSYEELARRVGDCVMNNNIRQNTEEIDDWETFSGETDYCFVHEERKDCLKDSGKCDYESKDIYQDYIITKSGAEYLQRNTNEIVFYSEKLDMYVWGITHFGTSWSGVFTNIKA